MRLGACAGELHASLDTLHDPASVLVHVPREDALAHLGSMADAHVVFLTHPVAVSVCARVLLQQQARRSALRVEVTTASRLKYTCATPCRACVQVAAPAGDSGQLQQSTGAGLFTEQCLDAFDLQAVRAAVGEAAWRGGAAAKGVPLQGRLVHGRLTVGRGGGGLQAHHGAASQAALAGGKNGARAPGG